MEESTGEGGLPVLKHKHGDVTNFPPAAVYIYIYTHKHAMYIYTRRLWKFT